MKILQIVPSISLVYGGPSQMVLGLSKGLADAGEDVTIITTNSNGDAGQAPLDVPLEMPIKQDGYQVIYFPCYPFRRYKFSLPLLNWLGTHAKDYQIAHIHALFSPVSTFAATVARNNKLPYILRPLGTLDPSDLQKKKQLKKIYGNLLEKPNLKGSAGVHFTSTEEAKVSQRYGVTTNDIIVPLGVSLPDKPPKLGETRQQLGIPEDTPLLIFMSRIEPKKGLSLLIEALENLVNKGIEFHLILAGTNPQDPQYENQMIQQIKDSKFGDRTTITGFIKGEYKLGLLQDADLFILPSYYENFGIAVAEAMAMETPVVISDQVHIWEEIEKASGGWICQCNVPSLTESLITALESLEEMKKRGINAKKLVNEKYDWSAIAKQMITIYNNLGRTSF
ncbi:MAG: hormogonium polysaccharide biosynthesis glycosyltransferase HpsP [Microcystaceae cyanobacterium]